YREIGVEVAALGYDGVTRRAHVSGRRKLQLAAECVAAHISGRGSDIGLEAPCLEETAYLAKSAARSGVAAEAATIGVSGQLVWTAELFARLRARDRSRRRAVAQLGRRAPLRSEAAV
ncbi:MAG: hypothetical protein AAGL49_14565, partial [Pseudomonadota bacterium]